MAPPQAAVTIAPAVTGQVTQAMAVHSLDTMTDKAVVRIRPRGTRRTGHVDAAKQTCREPVETGSITASQRTSFVTQHN